MFREMLAAYEEIECELKVSIREFSPLLLIDVGQDENDVQEK